MSNLNLQEIWNLQRELNIMIGRDTVGDPEKGKWFHDYTVALHDEATELFNCCNWKWWSTEGRNRQYERIIDLKNAKIEAIDCLHFLMSLMHIIDFKTNNKEESRWELIWKKYKNCLEEDFSEEALNLIIDSSKLIKLSLEGLYEKEIDIYETIISCSIYLIKLFIILDFKKEDILKIYKMKHEKNVLRQQNNYSVINKTEDDNNEIKAKI